MWLALLSVTGRPCATSVAVLGRGDRRDVCLRTGRVKKRGGWPEEWHARWPAEQVPEQVKIAAAVVLFEALARERPFGHCVMSVQG